MNRSLPLILISLLPFLLPTTAVAQEDNQAASASVEIDFETQIKPFFAKYCVACHGEEEEQGFRIDQSDSMMNYIQSGDPDASEIYTYMTLDLDDDDVMPPADEEPRPQADEIERVKLWIQQGAKLTADEVVEDPGEVEVVDPKTQQIYNATGSLHPALVHTPIGLLTAAALFALLSLRGSFVMSDCAYYCLVLGTLGAVAACVSGYFFSPMENRGTVNTIEDFFDTNQPVYMHRLAGVIATAAAIVICMIAKSSRNRDPDEGTLWKFLVILLAAGIGFVGHEGGKMTYGKDHYKDLEALVQSLMNGDDQAAEDQQAAEDNPDQDVPADESSATGETSADPSAGKDDQPAETETDDETNAN